MPISLDEVKHVARLARLELDEAELLAFQGELNALLGHFEDIQSVDVSELEPAPHAISVANVWREDFPAAALARDEALANAPISRAGLFIVPTIIEE